MTHLFVKTPTLIIWAFLFPFSFFPNVMQPPIAVFSNTVHSFFVRIGLCRKVVRRFDMSNAPPGLVINLPGIDPHDSERRRFVGLKNSIFLKLIRYFTNCFHENFSDK